MALHGLGLVLKQMENNSSVFRKKFVNEKEKDALWNAVLSQLRSGFASASAGGVYSASLTESLYLTHLAVLLDKHVDLDVLIPQTSDFPTPVDTPDIDEIGVTQMEDQQDYLVKYHQGIAQAIRTTLTGDCTVCDITI